MRRGVPGAAQPARASGACQPTALPPTPPAPQLPPTQAAQPGCPRKTNALNQWPSSRRLLASTTAVKATRRAKEPVAASGFSRAPWRRAQLETGPPLLSHLPKHLLDSPERAVRRTSSRRAPRGILPNELRGGITALTGSHPTSRWPASRAARFTCPRGRANNARGLWHGRQGGQTPAWRGGQ
jgi:hypothetical protein